MNESMPAIYDAMTISDIEKQKEMYSDNESIVKILDGYIQVKVQELAQAKAKEDFGKAITKIVSKLPHPEDIHNVYLAWREVEVEDTSAEPEEIPFTDPEGAEITELRYPKTKSFTWVVELNKGFSVGKSTSGNGSTTTKRAITLKKIEGDTLVPSGNYRTGSEACHHLKLLIGGDSATRVLQREGYLVQPYGGMDFTVALS